MLCFCFNSEFLFGGPNPTDMNANDRIVVGHKRYIKLIYIKFNLIKYQWMINYFWFVDSNQLAPTAGQSTVKQTPDNIRSLIHK